MGETTDLLRRYKLGSAGNTVQTDFDDGEEQRASCYGWLRGRHERVEMLELRFRSGRFLSIAYSWLYSVDFDAPHGITLNFGEMLVRLEGRSLMHIAECVRRHRLLWVEEIDPVRDQSADSAPAVTRITLNKSRDKGGA